MVTMMKNSRVLRTILFFVTILLFSCPAYAKYSGGTGEPNNPYQITTAEDLMLLGESPEDYDKHFILTADIDLDPNLPGRSVFGQAVIPSFEGSFVGNNHVIFNLKIEGGDRLGFFGKLCGGSVVRNLGLENVSVHSTRHNVGGLTGYNNGYVLNCYSSGAVFGGDQVGGLMGGNDGDVAHCHSSGEVTGDGAVGGLVGINGGGVTACSAAGVISASSYVGGLVGFNGGAVTACSTTAAVDGTDWSVGGLLGRNRGDVSNCHSTGAVHGGDNVGGLVGHNGGYLSNCYSTGVVVGIRFVGGLVGDNYGDVTSCFWDTQTSDQTTSAGGTGLTTAQMQTASTFLDAGWDFMGETANGTEDIWWILDGQGYPELVRKLSAFSPHPQDGATDVIQPIILHWAPGASALHHDVYLGEDEQAVADATSSSVGIHCGQHAVEVTSYDPGPLELGKTYYWRVEEANEADSDHSWKGDVWDFTTADYLIVDDFESYTDNDGAGEAIWQVWIDGFGIPENGATVGWCELSWGRGPRRIHGGAQSMDIYYCHLDTAYYSEVTANTTDLVIGKDWTQGGVGILSLWFYSDPDNAPEPMYVGLANVDNPTEVVYHDNPDAVLISEWVEWRIDLQEFTNRGVDLTNVDSISIGFGDKNNPQFGGEGLVFIDDIRLYLPHSTTLYDSEVNEP